MQPIQKQKSCDPKIAKNTGHGKQQTLKCQHQGKEIHLQNQTCIYKGYI